MVQGWFVGDFDPAAYKTPLCEVAYKKHKKGEFWPKHYQKQAVEINYLIRGVLEINGQRFVDGDIFTIHPKEIAEPTFVSDCELIVVKLPSLGIQDKVEC